MKKLFALLLCVLILSTLAIAAFAAGSSVSITPSETTLHRGDTFTIVANLTNSDAINLGTVVLSYDENVFELTGGTCHVAGANPAQVVVAQKAGTFFLGSASAVSGKIFTFNFKVKEDAAFGTYTFTTTAAIGTTGGNKIDATGTTITVACKHNYSNWKDAGNGKHSKTCSICQDVQTVSHTWNGGTVTKQPTCKETGVRTYTCTGCNATKTETIAKTTDHKYGSWTKVNDTTHKHTCSVCSKEETANHTWNSGAVTKQPTCKEEGVKTYTCTACNATKTESVAKTTDHKYGSWTKVNDTTHKHTCSVCSKEETANHTWNGGSVTKPASCKENGVKTYTCTACNATKTESIAKTTTHSYGKWNKVNETTHKHTCSVCSKEETANHTWNSGAVTKKATCKKEGVKTYTCTACNATKTESIAKLTTHTYDHDCDTDCNVCGATRTITHNYKTSWSKDKTNHWHECSVCKDKKDVVAHTPGAEATETTAQTCTTCGYVIKAALGHKHNYATTWTTDESGHWYACSGCAEKDSYATHDFENDCDKDCSICGYARSADHNYSADWKSDETNHWHECAGCGGKADEAAHKPGAAATETTAQTCTVCGYEIAPALGVKETEPATTPVTPTEPADKDEPSADPTVWIVVAVVILVGIVAGVIIWKKKR